MRGSGQGLAVMVRRALARLVARRDILGLAVAGGRLSDLSALRVVVSLRGREGLDAGALLALCQGLRGMLGRGSGERLPLFVIRVVAEDRAERAGAERAGAERARRSGVRGDGPHALGPWPPVVHGHRALWRMPLSRFSALAKRKGRRSRSPPSPWSVALSACG